MLLDPRVNTNFYQIDQIYKYQYAIKFCFLEEYHRKSVQRAFESYFWSCGLGAYWKETFTH